MTAIYFSAAFADQEPFLTDLQSNTKNTIYDDDGDGCDDDCDDDDDGPKPYEAIPSSPHLIFCPKLAASPTMARHSWGNCPSFQI